MLKGEEFRDEDVSQNYQYRAPYSDGVFEQLISISPRHRTLLDLGCGTGKIARHLSSSFDHVTAVDPSTAMLSVGKKQNNGNAPNISWVKGTAEAFEYKGEPFDLIVAAASIHWMDQEIVFPRLLDIVTEDHVFAVVDGDGAFQPPWQDEWNRFLAYWVNEMTGDEYHAGKKNTPYSNFMNRHKNFLRISGESKILSKPVTQDLQEFILCQHSRSAFTPAKLGSRLKAFDAELEAILTPYATDGQLTYQVQTQITWGSINPTD